MTKSAFIKKSAPKWTKMLAGGSVKSVASKQRLQDMLPTGVTKQVGQRSFGSGREGRVHNGFTQGRGDSVIKTFWDGPGSRTLTQSGVQHVAGVGGIGSKVDLMNLHPDILPEVFGQHSRGYVMERLKHVAENPDITGLRSTIKNSGGFSNAKYFDEAALPVKGGMAQITDFDRKGRNLMYSPKKDKLLISDFLVASHPSHPTSHALPPFDPKNFS